MVGLVVLAVAQYKFNIPLQVQRKGQPPTGGAQLRKNQMIDPNIGLRYEVPMKIGTPPQEFRMLLETDRSAVWVPNPKCDLLPSCAEKMRYNSSNSTTYKEDGMEVSIIYPRTGDMKGFHSIDTVELEGIVIPDFRFTEITDISFGMQEDDFCWRKGDGTLGLGIIPDGSHENPILQTMANKGLIDKWMFAIKSGKEQWEDDAILTIGGYDESLFKGEIDWIPAAPDENWRIKIDDILVDGQSRGVCENGACMATIDVMHYYIHTTASIASLMGLLDPDTLASDCSNLDRLPTLTFVIAGKKYELASRQWNLIEPIVSDSGADLCAQGLWGSRDMTQGLTIGNVFLRNFYVIYDASGATPRVGLAKLK